MVSGAIAGNISAEATTPTDYTFVEATRGMMVTHSTSLTSRGEESYAVSLASPQASIWIVDVAIATRYCGVVI
jgi:hypothetical protein